MRNVKLHSLKGSRILTVFIAVLATTSFYSCESTTNNKPQNQTIAQSEGYKLMTQKCYICHFERPIPAKRDSMLAPPMLRVQEHYKPSFPDKEAFVEAIVKWVNNPVIDSSLMPGAVRKFKVMPKLFYNENEIRLIAEVMYDYDFGDMPKHRGKKSRNLQLNHGDKWEVNQSTMEQIEEASQLTSHFNSDNISDYNQLGKDVFNHAKTILLDDSYNDEIFEQLHYFFADIEENMHTLIATKSVEEAKEQCKELTNKLNSFNQYFESK